MKVKKLIKHLEKVNQNAEVILSSDAEGNSFSLLDKGNISGETFYTKDFYGYIEGIDATEDCECIVLYPN